MNKHILNTAKGLFFSAALVTLAGCEREISTDVLATSPKVAEVFLDEFAAGVDFRHGVKPPLLARTMKPNTVAQLLEDRSAYT